MVENKPSLSIGLPVFNGEKYLKQALDSVRAQTYHDFELIISDNGSTDRTEEICREYLKKDNRICYYRSEKNRGLAWNWNRVFELSSGVYFKWVAHDDIMAPQFVEKCINALERDPALILCHSKNNMINEFGNVVGEYKFVPFTDSQEPHERFREVLNRFGEPTLAWLIFGVFRRDLLKKTRLWPSHIAGDWNLLAEISLVGRIYDVPEFLFSRRKHTQSYTEKHYDSQPRIRDYRNESLFWTGNTKRPLIVMPSFQSCFELFRSISHFDMSFSEQRLCYEEIWRWILRKGWRYLKSDIGYELDFQRMTINYGKRT